MPNFTKPASPSLQGGNAFATGLTRCFLVNEGSGSDVVDYSTNALDLTTRTSGSTASGTWGTDGTYGAYLTFDGSTKDAIGVDTNMPVGATAFSFAVLVSSTSTANKFFFGLGTTGNGDINTGFGGNPSTGLTLTSDNNSHDYGSGLFANDGVFHVWVFTTTDGLNFTAYFDGVSVGSGAVSSLSIVSGGTIYFGRPVLVSVTFWCACNFAGFQSWSRALSSGDVTSLQNDFWQVVRGASGSFTIAPTSIPKNHSNNITLTLTGSGTSWNNGTTIFTPSGVTGVTKISQNITSTTAATVVVTTDATHTGTLTITESVTGSATATTTVATATLSFTPTTGSVSTTPTLTLTGTNTVWTQETAAGLFTVSGGTGASIGTPTITTNTAGTVVLTTGSALGTLTVTDTSCGATATFTVARTTPATYYVRLDGNDSHTGLVDNAGGAWLTVSKANTGPAGGYIAGDTLVFDGAAGVTFSGNIAWVTSGTQSARCTISGTNGATIDSSAFPNSPGIQVLNSEFCTVNNLIITGPGVNSSTGATTSTTPGVDVFSNTTVGNNWRSINVTNCTVSGYYRGITFRSITGGANGIQSLSITATGGTFSITFGGQTLSGIAANVSAATLQSGLQGLSSIGSGNVTVTNPSGSGYILAWVGALAGVAQPLITLTTGSLTGGSAFATMVVPGGTTAVVGFENFAAANNTIHACVFAAIDTTVGGTNSGTPFYLTLGNTGLLGGYVGSNTVYDIYGDPAAYPSPGGPLLLVNCTGLVCERNVIHDCCTLGALHSLPAGGIGAIVFLECTASVMQFNEAYNINTNLAFDGCGFDLDGGVTNSVCQGNYSHENAGAGFQCGVFTGSNPTTNNVFRYNISRNDCRKNNGTSLLPFGGTGIIWHNNTVYLSSTGATGDPSAVIGVTGHKYYNNILVTTGGLKVVQHSSENIPSFVGNLYWSSGGTLNIGGQSTLAGWQGTGQETVDGLVYGVNADPLLSSPTSGVGTGTLPGSQVNTITYFNPASNSPTVGAGVMLGLYGLDQGPIDFHEYPSRTGALTNIGAVSYGAVSLLPPTGGSSGVSGARIFGGH